MPSAPKRKPTQSADLSLEQLAPPPPPPPFQEHGGLEGQDGARELVSLNAEAEDGEEDGDYAPGPSQRSQPHSQRKKVRRQCYNSSLRRCFQLPYTPYDPVPVHVTGSNTLSMTFWCADGATEATSTCIPSPRICQSPRLSPSILILASLCPCTSILTILSYMATCISSDIVAAESTCWFTLSLCRLRRASMSSFHPS